MWLPTKPDPPVTRTVLIAASFLIVPHGRPAGSSAPTAVSAGGCRCLCCMGFARITQAAE